MIDDEGEVYIIVPPVEEMQGKISDLFLTALSSHGYEVIRGEVVDGKAVALAKNPAGISVTFLLDPASKEIQMMHTMPLVYRISVHDHGLAEKIMDVSLQTRRVSVLLDRNTREIVLITAIDLLGTPSFNEIFQSIKNRWQEIEEIRNSGIAEFVDVARSGTRAETF